MGEGLATKTAPMHTPAPVRPRTFCRLIMMRTAREARDESFRSDPSRQRECESSAARRRARPRAVAASAPAPKACARRDRGAASLTAQRPRRCAPQPPFLWGGPRVLRGTTSLRSRRPCGSIGPAKTTTLVAKATTLVAKARWSSIGSTCDEDPQPETISDGSLRTNREPLVRRHLGASRSRRAR